MNTFVIVCRIRTCETSSGLQITGISALYPFFPSQIPMSIQVGSFLPI